MNSQTYQQNTIQIDIAALLKKALIQWRAIIIFAVILGLLVSGLKYIKDLSSYKAALALSKDETSSDDIIKKSGLTVDEQDAVQLAVSQKKQIESQSEYLSDSLYMNLDPMNLKQLSLLYFIKAKGGSDAADLLTVYKEELLSDSSVEKIRKASGIDTRLKYIRELIDVSDAKYSDRGTFTKNSSTDVMKVTFYLPDGIDGSAIKKTIDKIISSYDISDNVASGSVSRISADINTVTDRDMQTTQTNYTTNLNNLKSTYNTSTDGFSDDQKTLFKKLLRENNLYDENTSTRLKESSEKQKEEKETSQNGDSSADAESTDNTTPVPSYPAFSIKYFAIGFILAVMLYIFCMVVYEILRSRCSIVAGFLGNSRIGVFMDTTNKKSGFLFCDKMLMKVLYREQADLVNGIDRVLTKAQMSSSNDRLSDAEIWTVGFDAESVPLIESIKRAASEKSINVTVHSTSDGRPEAMISDIAPEKSVILVACDGVSRKKDISFLTEMLMTRKADYLGVVEII